jgi:GGDEF domain-containing protein
VRDLITTLFREADLTETGRSLWEPALPLLERAAAGEDPEPFLSFAESQARGAGISQSIPVVALLGTYSRASGLLVASLESSDAVGAPEAARRLRVVERVALTRIASGYSAGLEETISRLRARVADASPVDDDSGAIKSGAILERLDLEVNRCQRMNLSLGLLALEPQEGAFAQTTVHVAGRGSRHQVGECLRGNLRRYDSIGLTRQGGFLLVLPDISRRGLSGAAERLRRELDVCVAPRGASDYVFALAHYDFVDTDPAEMLTALESSVREARSVHEPLTWC